MPDLPARRTSRNPIVRLLLLGLLLLAATNLSGCASGGDRAAANELDRVADSIAREAQQHWRRTITDPVWLALWAADDSHPMPTDTSGHKFAVRVEPLTWTTENGDGVLEVRIRVDAAGYSAVSFGERSYSRGSATECFRMVTGADPDKISCRGRTVPPLPARPVVAPLEEPQYDVIRSALRLDSLEQATAAAKADFPEFVIKSDVVDGAWVLVVIRSKPYACAAGVRFHPDRPGVANIEIVVPSPRIAKPGEAGCEPYAILHPPKTH